MSSVGLFSLEQLAVCTTLLTLGGVNDLGNSSGAVIVVVVIVSSVISTSFVVFLIKLLSLVYYYFALPLYCFLIFRLLLFKYFNLVLQILNHIIIVHQRLMLQLVSQKSVSGILTSWAPPKK